MEKVGVVKSNTLRWRTRESSTLTKKSDTLQTAITSNPLAHAHDETRDKRHYSYSNRLFRDELMLIGLWLW